MWPGAGGGGGRSQNVDYYDDDYDPPKKPGSAPLLSELIVPSKAVCPCSRAFSALLFKGSAVSVGSFASRDARVPPPPGGRVVRAGKTAHHSRV